jgi:serine/threonine protein kinase
MPAYVDDELAAYRNLPPGWYRDAAEPTMARYWDGNVLGAERRPVAPAVDAPTVQTQSQSRLTVAPSTPSAQLPTTEGWYSDPVRPDFERFWDGSAWTTRTRRVMSQPDLVSRATASGTASPTTIDTSLVRTTGMGTRSSGGRPLQLSSIVADREGVLRSVLPGYEIGTELGRGAFGVVISGRHRQLGREVAIKQLAPGLVDNESVRTRFLSEAQVLASIDHPHIVPVYDYVEQDDSCALVMERLGGGTVWRRFVDRGFDQRSACAIALVACSGLHDAHRRGVLHRDMKPENMLFGHDRVLKVTDFGIAHLLGEDNTFATRDGELLGTPAYMAPEQASGADLGPATDVYAAGVMLYELLSGRLPFPEEGGGFAIVMRHMNDEPLPLLEAAPSVPPHLAYVVDKALSRDPADRFDSAEDFGIAIGQAAAAAWGAGWLDASEVTLRDPGPILSRAQRAPSGAAAPSAARNGAKVVRPDVELHTQGGAATGVMLNELMPLRQTPAEMPPFPKTLVWAGVALALFALLLGLFGAGSFTPSPVLQAGTVTVAGHDPATGPVSLNLERQIPVVLEQVPAGVGSPTTAQLVLSLGGLSVVHSTKLPLVRGPGGLATLLDASSGRYLVGGKLQADLVLSGPRGTVEDAFEVHAVRSPVLTLAGAFVILVALIVAAYAESYLRALRRGRRHDNRTAIFAVTVVGLCAGATFALLGWLLGLAAPTFLGLLIPAIPGVAAGFVGALAAAQVGVRARAVRQSHRLVLVARRRAETAPQAASAGTG